jgi:peptide chain release factor 1
MRGKLSSTVLKTSTGGDTCAEFIQHSNKRDAIRIMTARVQDKRKAAADKEYSEFRRKILGDGSRGQKVRTYNFMESRVTDHRTNKKVTNIKAIMKGELDLLK